MIGKQTNHLLVYGPRLRDIKCLFVLNILELFQQVR